MRFLSPILLPRQHYEGLARAKQAYTRKQSSGHIVSVPINSLVRTKMCIPPQMDWDTFCAEKDIQHPREAWMLLTMYALMCESQGYAKHIAASERAVVMLSLIHI